MVKHYLRSQFTGKKQYFSTYEKNVEVVLLDGNFTRVHEVDQMLQLVEVDLAEDDGGMVGRILRKDFFQVSG